MPRLYSNLPREIKVRKEMFYCDEPIYGYQVPTGEPNKTKALSVYLSELKAAGINYRIISVLSRNLRGKTDLHHQPYKPNRWIFINQKK